MVLTPLWVSFTSSFTGPVIRIDHRAGFDPLSSRSEHPHKESYYPHDRVFRFSTIGKKWEHWLILILSASE
jgi:hypothetical protein